MSVRAAGSRILDNFCMQAVTAVHTLDSAAACHLSVVVRRGQQYFPYAAVVAFFLSSILQLLGLL